MCKLVIVKPFLLFKINKGQNNSFLERTNSYFHWFILMKKEKKNQIKSSLRQ